MGEPRGDLKVRLDLDEIEGDSRAEVEGGMNPGPQRTAPLMTYLTCAFRGYPLHLSTCRTIAQTSLRYLEQNRLLLGMPWKVPIPPHYCGRNRSKRKSNSRKVQPKGVGLGLRAILSLMCPPVYVSMIDNGLFQHDLDIMVEEEREVDMEIGAPASPTAPMPPEESPMQQGSEAVDIVQDDQLSQMSEESTDQNPPQTQISMRKSYWGQLPMSLALISGIFGLLKGGL